MSAYRKRNRLVFCTLAVGDKYVERSHTLIQSVLKFTHSKIYVVTDQIDNIVEQFPEDLDRVIPLQITGSFAPTRKCGRFNYSLKFLAIQKVNDLLHNQEILCYADSDTFLFGWDEGVEAELTRMNTDVFGRYLGDAASVFGEDPVRIAKVKKLGVEDAAKDIPVFTEAVMFFRCSSKISEIMSTAIFLGDELEEAGVPSFMESIELGVAIHKSNAKYAWLNSDFGFVENFRTLHNDKIITPFVI